jgi:3-phosphoshikimate 1-carboxyvinyltransferase
MAATARGHSRLAGLPPSLDVRAMASCLASVTGRARPALEVWADKGPSAVEGGGSTWNADLDPADPSILEVEGEGRDGLVEPASSLDCGNSGTAMRLLAGVLAAAPFPSVLTGDASLSRRPMERVAAPLRAMGAAVRTVDGHAPVRIEGGRLRGADLVLDAPSAQVKTAILLAGLAADGTTSVREPRPTRDHTERLLRALGAPVEMDGAISVSRFQHDGFDGTVPGDPSSAVFLVAAAALTGTRLTIEGVGINPSRLHVLEVLARMGIGVETEPGGERMGEPVGSLHVEPTEDVRPVEVGSHELPLVIDEVPMLACVAAFAAGPSRFLGAGELRVKESDRLAGVAAGLRALGGDAEDRGDDLVVGGGGLGGGTASSEGDHRLAMAFAVAGLAASEPVTIDGAEAADVSFPGFWPLLRSLGAAVEEPV